MKEQLEKALADEFPFLRRGLTKEEQMAQLGGIYDLYGAFGLDIGNGWFQIIHDMCAEITKVYQTEGEEVDLVVDQVKEKFGTLRFYYHPKGHDVIFHAFDFLDGGPSLQVRPGTSNLYQKVAEIVKKYEEMSGHVCEVCGKPGSLRNDLRWVLTLCEEHYRRPKQT